MKTARTFGFLVELVMLAASLVTAGPGSIRAPGRVRRGRLRRRPVLPRCAGDCAMGATPTAVSDAIGRLGGMMVEQLAGAGIATAVVLGYVLLVECLTAAVILLAEFIIGRVRVLWSLVVTRKAAPEPEPAEPPEAGEPYRVGGGLMKW